MAKSWEHMMPVEKLDWLRDRIEQIDKAVGAALGAQAARDSNIEKRLDQLESDK